MRVLCVLVMAGAVATGEEPNGRAVAGRDKMTLGNVTVSVTRVGLFPAYLHSPGERYAGTDGVRRLCLEIVVSTDDGAKKVDYNGWRHSPGVKAADKFGNGYEVFRESAGQRLEDSANGRGIVSKGRPVSDRLYFDRPIADADFIDVDLPGEAVGVKGEVFRFRVTKATWEPKPVAAPKKRR
jgi:hypothetical protein